MLVLLFMYELCRIIFYVFNHAYFSDLSFSRLMYYLFVGLRFDICAIVFTNLPFIVLSILPFGSEQSIYRRYFLKFLFIIVNSLALFIQMGDTAFLPFVYKRSTDDIFKFVRLGDDTLDVLPAVAKDYWYILLIWVALIFLMIYLYNRVGKKAMKTVPEDHHYIAASISSYIIAIAFLVLGFRGGWQLKPISIIDAADYAPAHDIPLVINSPFSIAKTIGAPSMKEYHFFALELLPAIYPTTHNPSAGTPRKINVVTIILESFSKEYIGALNNHRHPTNTPFLDSLISQSLVFGDAYSDGKKSIEGIPAVVAGLPSWMDEPYITSSYNSDNVSSLANMLGKEGYTTAFFHGGTNGTMGFQAFCKEAGFNYYYGRTEYNNDKDYDGNWGIWDEDFFQYFARNLDTMHQPFYGAIFSISSHHPFSIPEKYKAMFPQKGDEMPILKCVRYSDMALRKFFETASHMPWFDSTLFVITADHTGPSADVYFSNRVGMYEIPIIYYMHNSSLKGMSNMVTQHVDIMPSVLDYIHYPYPYFAFGKSVFDNNPSTHFAVSYINGVYQVVKAPYCLQIDGKTVSALYNYKRDSMLTHNLMAEMPQVKDSLTTILEAVMQAYGTDIIHNQMQLKKGGN